MSKFNDLWLPGILTGVIFTAAGAGLGWCISRSDTKAEIDGITQANAKLQVENGVLHQQDGVLQTQILMLRAQRASLDKLLKGVAQTDHDVRLIVDSQGHVLAAQVITDSNGRAILNSSGHPITTSGSREP